MADPTGDLRQNSDAETLQQLYYDSAETQAPTPSPKKPKRHTALKVFIWLVVIVLILILALVISSMIAGFNTVFDMIDWILDPAHTGIGQV